MNWTGLLLLLGGAVMIFFLYRYIKSNPEMLSKQNLIKSMGTMGMLGLGLIAFVALLVFMTQV